MTQRDYTEEEIIIREKELTFAVVDAGSFLFDEPTTVTPRWGNDVDVLWQRGESLIVCGPPGVGKTTLIQQVALAAIGLRDDVLGLPIEPADRVLYLAADRPAQIRRSLLRMVAPDDRDTLTKRLSVHRGALPRMLLRDTDQLHDLAVATGADLVIVDSLKDLVTTLSGDEDGNAITRAFGRCTTAGIDIAALHHQRKAGTGDGKPKTLADLYGSAWIAAGAGSVVLLWGEPGADLVDLIHLKQPSTPVGPWKLAHDHNRGTTTIEHGFDLLAYLRMQGAAGATGAQLIQAEHASSQPASSAKGKKTLRRADALVAKGLAQKDPQERGDGTGFEGVRYYATIPESVI